MTRTYKTWQVTLSLVPLAATTLIAWHLQPGAGGQKAVLVLLVAVLALLLSPIALIVRSQAPPDKPTVSGAASFVVGSPLSDVPIGTTEISLRERERELKEAHRIARLGTWRWVKPTNVLTWSPEVYRIYGCDPSQPPPRGDATRKLTGEKSWIAITTALQGAFDYGERYEIDLSITGVSCEPR